MFKYQTLYTFFERLNNKHKTSFKYFFEEITNTQQKDYILNINLGFKYFLRLLYATLRLYITNNIYYAIGHKHFLDLEIKVNKNVLVPRFETELLLIKLTNKLNQQNFNNIIDLGTGSGVIAIYLKKHFPKANISAIDISKKALAIAKINALNNNVSIDFKKRNFNYFDLSNYDVVVSNPPYIDKSEQIDTNVYQTEPHLALFADNDGLACYQKIINNCTYKNKFIAFEIGEKQGKSIKEMLLKKFPNATVTIEKDLNSCDRYVFANIKR